MQRPAITIIDTEPLGQGMVWKVYSCRVSSAAYPDPLIIKIPMGFAETSVKTNIVNYGRIKAIGLPTLSYFQEIRFNGKAAIIGQHLNCQEEEIFVSPNTLITDKQRMIEILNSFITKKNETKPDSKAEIFRYRNKLREVIDLHLFIEKVKYDLIQVSKHHILIEFDSYFFGSAKHSVSSKLSYCIADFDHIFKMRKKAQANLLKDNLLEFKRALRPFIEYFCEANDCQQDYLKLIELEL